MGNIPKNAICGNCGQAWPTHKPNCINDPANRGKKVDEVKEVTRWHFAGTDYETREDAEHAMAKMNLRDFIHHDMSDVASEERDIVIEYLVRNFEEYISLLNKLY